MKMRFNYSPGDRVYFAKKLRLGAEVRSGIVTEIKATADGTFVRIENHGLAPAHAVFADPESAMVEAKNYNRKLEG